MLTNILPALAGYKNFTLWRLDPPKHPQGKALKIAMHADLITKHSLGMPERHGKPAIPPNPAPLLSLEEARAALAYALARGVVHDRAGEPGYGSIGFRPAGTGFACLDVDNCLTAEGWSPRALDMFARFPGAGAELSTSGRGLHLWFRYTGEGPGRRGPDPVTGSLELYGEGQFLALGQPLAGSGPGDVDHTAPMRALLAEFWPAASDAPREVTAHDWAEKTPQQRAEVKAQLLDAARLACPPGSSYHDWYAVGAALVSLGDEEGRELWHEISSWDPCYDEAETEDKWSRIGADRTDYRAIFAKAQAQGWVNPNSTEARIAVAVASFGEGVVGAMPAPVAPPPAAGPLLGTTLSHPDAATGALPGDLPTVCRLLESTPGGPLVGRDDFLGSTMIRSGGQWRRVENEDFGDLRIEAQTAGLKPVAPEIMKTAVLSVARRNRFDSAQDWAGALEWDGTERVTMALHRYYGVEDTPYTRACSEYLFTALAGRALDPGCQADMALVLVGLQGAQKTSAVRALAPFPEAFVEINLEKRDDDLSRRLRGKLVGEMAELRGLSSRDVGGIRAWITRRFESWVEKYETVERTFPRRLVLIGTVNEGEFLDDPEGERRWLPMRVGRVDVAALQRDCEQLWAEGVAMWRAGGIRWQEAERLAKAEHQHYKVSDGWQEYVEEWLAGVPNVATDGFAASESGRPRGEEPLTLPQILTGAVKLRPADIDVKTEKRIAKIMRRLNYDNRSVWVKELSKTARRWVRV